MLKTIRWTAARSFPLALLTFCLITARAVAACVDGPDEIRFGFPFFWITPGVMSLSWIIDVPALIVDFIVYLFVWTLLLKTALFVRLFSWKPRALLISVWMLALLVAGLYITLLGRDVFTGGVTFNRSFECSSIKQYSLNSWFPH
ncbi:MAG TPA: hypothetical protein VM095_17820 [Pyrinomonadaceae bacterium]|nr:hypothetical protein [Pyrinomonadaceae bacterium]